MAKKKSKKKVPLHQSLSFWRALVVVLIIMLLLVIFPDGKRGSDNILSEDMIRARTVSFLESSLAPGTDVEVHHVTDVGQVYSVSVTVGNESATLYSSKDGRYLFPGAFDVGEKIPTAATYAIGGGERNAGVSIDDDEILGDVNAPVTIIEFSDYECPMCGRFWKTTFHDLKQEYIDTGKVRFVFRDFALSYHTNSQKAAEASECAADQGMFWEYHDKLFGSGELLSDQAFTRFAAELGMDVGLFSMCLESGKYEDEVRADFDDGVAAGIQGTPSFFINGIPLAGAQPLDSFREVIDAELGQ